MMPCKLRQEPSNIFSYREEGPYECRCIPTTYQVKLKLCHEVTLETMVFHFEKPASSLGIIAYKIWRRSYEQIHR